MYHLQINSNFLTKVLVISDAAINMLAKGSSNSYPIAAPSILNIFSHHS